MIRLFAASIVLFSHCYPLSGRHDEFFAVHWGLETGGGIGVAIFFFLSGFLVTRSLFFSKSVLRYLLARFLRIFPGLTVVVLLSTFLLGPVLTTLSFSEYFQAPQSWDYLKNCTLFPPLYVLPGVFAANPLQAINGSLWTLPVEVTMYGGLLVLFLVTPFNKYSAAVVTTLFAAGYFAAVNYCGLTWENQGRDLLAGVSLFSCLKLGLLFSLGSTAFFFRSRIAIRFCWGLLSAVVIILAPFCGLWGYIIFAVAVGYLILYIGFIDIDLHTVLHPVGDISYGMYIYAFPVQQTLVQLCGDTMSIATFFISATCITSLCALLSWHLVEKRFLQLKKIFNTRVGQ